jgi:hypothetical protein
MIFIYCNWVSTGWQWSVNQTCKCFARTGTTMNTQWRGHVTSTAKIRNVHDFNRAIRTEESTRQTEAVTGGRLQTCISEKYDINLPQAGFCQHGNGQSGFLTIRTFLDQ